MFALTFMAGGKAYGLDLKNVLTVLPAFDLNPDNSHPLPFVGWHGDGKNRVPAFDLNFAITSKPAMRLFGTRHILASVDFGGARLKIALIAERVSQVLEFPDPEISGEDTRVFITARSGNESVEIVNLEKILDGSLFEYEA